MKEADLKAKMLPSFYYYFSSGSNTLTPTLQWYLPLFVYQEDSCFVMVSKNEPITWAQQITTVSKVSVRNIPSLMAMNIWEIHCCEIIYLVCRKQPIKREKWRPVFAFEMYSVALGWTCWPCYTWFTDKRLHILYRNILDVCFSPVWPGPDT